MSHEFKPGCFGSSLCYSSQAKLCQVCLHAEACAPAAVARAERLRVMFGVQLPVERPRVRRSISIPEPINKKAAELLDRIVGKGIDLREAVRARHNPFLNQPPTFLRIAVNRLIEGGCDRSDLRAQFISELGWSEMTAVSHAAIAVGVLTGAGAARMDGSRLLPVVEAVA